MRSTKESTTANASPSAWGTSSNPDFHHVVCVAGTIDRTARSERQVDRPLPTTPQHTAYPTRKRPRSPGSPQPGLRRIDLMSEVVAAVDPRTGLVSSSYRVVGLAELTHALPFTAHTDM